MSKGILVALFQCLLVLSIAGKYAIDRQRLPRVWVPAEPVDPTLPVRGRYIALRLQIDCPVSGNQTVRLAIRDGRLSAIPSSSPGLAFYHYQSGQCLLSTPVSYFIPEHAEDPSRALGGKHLWVEVSVPAEGAPRPLRLERR